MVFTRKELKEYLIADARNFKNQTTVLSRRLKADIFSSPISEQKHIWGYIKHMRFVEYYGYMKTKSRIYLLPYLYHLSKLRKESHITGFQIAPGTCGKGLTIWHWGPIIINGKARIGDNCTLFPGVLIGQKSSGGECPKIGNNVFIGSGTKIIGAIKIGDNVTIGQNCVIVKDVADNQTIVVSDKFRII